MKSGSEFRLDVFQMTKYEHKLPWVLEMNSRPFPAPVPHCNPVPFPLPPDSRLRID